MLVFFFTRIFVLVVLQPVFVKDSYFGGFTTFCQGYFSGGFDTYLWWMVKLVVSYLSLSRMALLMVFLLISDWLYLRSSDP